MHFDLTDLRLFLLTASESKLTRAAAASDKRTSCVPISRITVVAGNAGLHDRK